MAKHDNDTNCLVHLLGAIWCEVSAQAAQAAGLVRRCLERDAFARAQGWTS